ncbi:MAG: transposase [Myxococcales bacterium]|nr:transposase [Myxococcales bacterium]
MTKDKNQKAAPQRGRPGRRSAAERSEAVRLLLSGKASVEQLAQKYAVSQETIESWRAQGLEALDTSFRTTSGSSAKQKELERELAQMKSALTRAVMEKELLQQALDIERAKRPTGPRRSSR